MCGSANNRLMKFESWEYSPTIIFFGPMTQGSDPAAQGSGPMAPGFGGPIPSLLSTTYYYYNYEGNVTRVVTKKTMPMDSEPQYEATRLGYARNGRVVTYALGETWNYNGTSITNLTINYAREFRYDSARQRYLNRTLSNQTLGTLSSIWSDYDGDMIYGDFSVTSGPPGSPPTVTEARSFQPGIAMVDPWSSIGSANTKYYNADMIGTTRHMTDLNGNGVEPAVYTAFGEQVSGTMAGPGDRYGYAGSWGYQTHDDFPFLHVGARYYDPATGRFLQRDPIGILGGLNVYAYPFAPTTFVDPEGLTAMECVARGFLWITGGQRHVPVLDPGTAQDIVQVTAEIVSIAAPGGVILKGGRIMRRAKGFEVTINRNFRFGWHRFKQRTTGKVVNRPHYHRRRVGGDGKTRPGGGIGRHRPWERSH